MQYRPFVIKTSKKFAASGVAPEDLIQEGLMAVAVAFRAWREDGGANFLTWIRRPVYYAMLKLSREQRRAGGSLRGAVKSPGQKGKARVDLVSMDTQHEVVTLRIAGLGEDVRSLHEVVPAPAEEPHDPFLSGRLPALVSGLEKRERQVLRLRFEKGLAYTEVGVRLKISRELARQIEQKALERLKALMTNGEEVES